MPRILFLLCSGFVFLQALTGCAEESAPNLKAILTAYQKREDGNDAIRAHLNWLKSDAGRAEAAYLAEHYDDLTKWQKRDIPLELARTGLPAIVPLVKKSLADPENDGSALAGIFYACFLAEAKIEYRLALAPAVVPWLGKGSESHDTAIVLLPAMDADLAARALFTDEFLSVDAPRLRQVLTSLNDEGLAVPLPRIRKILEPWAETGPDEGGAYRVRSGYCEAVRALAFHDAKESLEIADRIIKKNPLESFNYDKVPLAAAGLTGLYRKLDDHAEDPAKFSQLPESAQIYYAVTNFETDLESIGIGQALGRDYFSLAKKGYAAIGDEERLRYLEHMCQPFGPSGPSPDLEQRNKQMKSMKPDYWEQEDELREAWHKKSGDQPSLSTYWLLNLYAAKNAAILKPFVKEAIR